MTGSKIFTIYSSSSVELFGDLLVKQITKEYWCASKVSDVRRPCLIVRL